MLATLLSLLQIQPLERDQLEQEHSTKDSFSSSPDSDFNKGAAQVISLLESALARAQKREDAIRFEDLLIQMLDLSVDKKLGTPCDITEILKIEGWDASQVVRV